MISCHFHMKLADCPIERYISKLFVHIMNSCSRLISKNYSECFDVIGSSLEDLIN